MSSGETQCSARQNTVCEVTAMSIVVAYVRQHPKLLDSVLTCRPHPVLDERHQLSRSQMSLLSLHAQALVRRHNGSAWPELTLQPRGTSPQPEAVRSAKRQKVVLQTYCRYTRPNTSPSS